MLEVEESNSLMHELAVMGWLLVMMLICLNYVLIVNVNGGHSETVKGEKQIGFWHIKWERETSICIPSW